MTPRPRVFATRALPGVALTRLAECTELEVWPHERSPDPASLQAAASRSDGLLCVLSDRLDAEFFEHCPSLRVVSSVSVGVDHVDLAAASARGLPVGHTPGVLAETTADLAFALMLASARRVVEADRELRAGLWTPERHWDPAGWLGRDVHGATLGLLGLGAIGSALARRAAGFGMRVLGWSRSGRVLPGVETTTFERVLRAADFLSVHVALTPDTQNLVDARALAALQPGAFLINTARGGIVDEAALIAALESGQIAGAALDVFEREPLPTDSPLLRAPNLVLTPHIGSASTATRIRMADLAVDNLLAGLAGEPLPHCANPQYAEIAEALAGRS